VNRENLSFPVFLENWSTLYRWINSVPNDNNMMPWAFLEEFTPNNQLGLSGLKEIPFFLSGKNLNRKTAHKLGSYFKHNIR